MILLFAASFFFAHADTPAFYAVGSSVAETGAAIAFPESPPLARFCDGKKKIWVVEDQKEFTCTHGKYDEEFKPLPDFLAPITAGESFYIVDVKIVTPGNGRPKPPAVRQANAAETAAAKDLAAAILKARKKPKNGKEQIYAFGERNVQVADLSEGRKMMIFPAVLFLGASSTENFALYSVGILEKGRWKAASKAMKVYNDALSDRDGVIFSADLEGKGWPAIRYQTSDAGEMRVEYANVYPAEKIIAVYVSQGPND
jgi:hypothetical protein